MLPLTPDVARLVMLLYLMLKTGDGLVIDLPPWGKDPRPYMQ